MSSLARSSQVQGQPGLPDILSQKKPKQRGETEAAIQLAVAEMVGKTTGESVVLGSGRTHRMESEFGALVLHSSLKSCANPGADGEGRGLESTEDNS